MSDRSAIEWTDASWNPLIAYGERLTADATGYARHRGWHCEHVSEGCRNCYAETINRRLGTGRDYKPGHRANLSFRLDEKTLLAPLHWRKPRKIFVCSMTDLFGDWVTDEHLDKIFAVMALCPQHTFQVLTKRAEWMRTYWLGEHRYRDVHPVEDRVNAIADAAGRMMEDGDNAHDSVLNLDWPLPNVWLGVSCEDQATADERIPLLLDTPAAVRFISAEPLLGSIDLTRIVAPDDPEDPGAQWLFDALTTGDIYEQRCEGALGEVFYHSADGPYREAKIDWVIAGGESGPNARPVNPVWLRSLRDQCRNAEVAYFMKQFGEWAPGEAFGMASDGPVSDSRGNVRDWMHRYVVCADRADRLRGHSFTEHATDLAYRVGKKRAGRKLDGVEWNEFPKVRA